MSFFNKPADQDKWKEKYLDLLDEQEQSEVSSRKSEETYKEKEDLLCKTIVRLTIATTGLDPLLDPHLVGIRDQLKNGINSQALKDELEKFTNSVAQIKHTPHQNGSTDTDLLFDFLLQQYTTEIQQNALKLLKKKAGAVAVAGATKFFETPNQLFIAILEVIEPNSDTSAPNTLPSILI